MTTATIETEIADVLADARSQGFNVRSIRTIASHRVAKAAGRPVRTPKGEETRQYLDALDKLARGERVGGVASAILARLVERLEALLRQQAACRLRREIDALDRELDATGRRRDGDPLFERALELYAEWAWLAYPEPAPERRTA